MEQVSEHPGPALVRAEQSAAPDCLQRPLLRRSRFRQQVSASVRLRYLRRVDPVSTRKEWTMAVLVLLEATVKAEYVHELQSLLQQQFPAARAYDGCQGITAYVHVDDGRTLVVVQQWTSKEAHQRYMAWRRETGVQAQFAKMWEGPSTVRYFETVDA